MADPVPGDTPPTVPNRLPVGNTTQPALAGGAFAFLSPPRSPGEFGRLGDYRVLRLLGTGGMGFVFEAEELSLHRRVALKVLKPELAADPDSRERFLREARAAAAVESDHVVTIYHVGDGETPHFAMQFLDGESLQARTERQPPLTLREALEIARQAAEGLACAHARGLTHRDIKPANLWLERTRSAECGMRNEGGNPRKEPTASGSDSAFRIPHSEFRVRLLDFGLARRSTGETSLTSTGFIVGTPNFMSPEQASGADVDGRADLFSLGCVLYTLLVGRLPFEGSTAMAVMMALANRTPPPVNETNPSVPAEVGAFVARLLEKDPARRPQSAGEVAAVLESFLAHISGSVPLPSSSQHPKARHGHGETIAPGTSATLAPSPAVPMPTEVRAARRRSRVVMALLGAVILTATGFGVRSLLREGPPPATQTPAPTPIVVGVLHSQTGTMAPSEKPVIDATLMAIDELNAAGGVLGRRVRAVVADGKSDPDEFAHQASRLLSEEKVVAIFGCWTSSSRRAVREVLQQKNDGVLFYPVQYEGLGDSPRIVYLGPAPNQQLIPAVDFLTRPVAAGGLGKKRLYLVGSDYLFPHVTHEIIRDQVKLKAKDGVAVVGETFLPLGSDQGLAVVTKLVPQTPDAIVNTLNGGTNVSFFRELRKAGFTPDKVPTLSLSLTENEVMGLNPPSMAGDYLAASYFQTVDTPASREFLRKLRERDGPNRIATDPMAAAYDGVRAWAKAAEKAGTADANAVLRAVRGLELDGVRGRLTIDPETRHAWLPVRIGKIRPDGLVDLVPGVGSDVSVRPVPFPPTRKPEEWGQLLHSLWLQWDSKWQPPGKSDKK